MKPSLWHTARRFVVLSVLFALAAAACTNGEPDIAATTVPPSVPSTTDPTGFADDGPTPTSEAPAVIRAGAERIVAESLLLPRIEPIVGEAPVSLAGHEPGGVSAVTYPGTIPWDGPDPPPGLSIEIESCVRPVPGVLMIDGVIVDDGSVGYPTTMEVFGSVASGDVGTVAGADVTFQGPGPFTLVLSSVEHRAALAAAGRTDFDFVDRGEAGRRPRNWNSGGCSLEARPLRTEETPLILKSGALEVTAPEGTIEALAQSISPEGEQAPLYPLLVVYGEAIHFLSERWFLPSETGEDLISIREHLDHDRCLALEMTFETYTVLQQRDCPLPASGGVFGAGSTWFAIASDGEWIIQVRADSETKVTEVVQTLRPYWHLMHNALPLEPIGELFVGRVPFEGGEVLVTIATPDCEDCVEPTTWFHIYRIAADGLEPFARYPAYDRCGLVEEDSFILGVAPRKGSIEVTRGTEVEIITATRDDRPFVLLEPDDSATVRVLNRNGKVSPCVAQGTNDTRGGIGPFTVPEPPSYPDPAAFRELAAQPCDESVPRPHLVPEPPIARACIDTDFGEFVLVHAETNEQLTDPPQTGLECLVTVRGNSASNTCWDPATVPGVVDWSSGQRHSWLSAVVPEDATRIVAVTSTGTELVSIPHQRIGFVWWHDYEGKLLTVVAEAPSGDTVLYPEED